MAACGCTVEDPAVSLMGVAAGSRYTDLLMASQLRTIYVEYEL
jgi:hypothetical protein